MDVSECRGKTGEFAALLEQSVSVSHDDEDQAQAEEITSDQETTPASAESPEAREPEGLQAAIVMFPVVVPVTAEPNVDFVMSNDQTASSIQSGNEACEGVEHSSSQCTTEIRCVERASVDRAGMSAVAVGHDGTQRPSETRHQESTLNLGVEDMDEPASVALTNIFEPPASGAPSGKAAADVESSESVIQPEASPIQIEQAESDSNTSSLSSRQAEKVDTVVADPKRSQLGVKSIHEDEHQTPLSSMTVGSREVGWPGSYATSSTHALTSPHEPNQGKLDITSADVPLDLQTIAAPGTEQAKAPVAFHSERLIERLAGSELTFTVRLTDTNNVQVATHFHERLVDVGIRTSSTETASALRNEVSALESQLRDHALELRDMHIALQDGSSMNAGYSGEQRSRQEWRSPVMPFVRTEHTGMRSDIAEETSLYMVGTGDEQISLLA